MIVNKIYCFIKNESIEWIENIVRKIPGRIGIEFRRIYWKYRFANRPVSLVLLQDIVISNPGSISMGNHVSIMQYSKVNAHTGGQITIGHNVSINSSVLLSAADKGKISIGNNVLIGPNSVLRASNHLFESIETPIKNQGHSGGLIRIDDDVWIGANVVILPDVYICRGSIVAAGAVVTRNVPEFTIVGGVPARKIGYRGDINND
jgi:galactoside O-acetyltransferase